MNDTFEAVVKHFETAEVQYQADSGTGMVRAVLPTGVGVWHAHVRVEEDLMEVVIYHPVRIPQEKRRDLAELLARVGPWNNLVRTEMEFDTGQLMTRARMMFDEAAGLGSEEAHNPVIATLLTLEALHPAVMAILYQGKTSKEAADKLREDETDLPHADRFNLPMPEGGLPCPELPEDGLRNN